MVEAPPFPFDRILADQVRPALRALVGTLLAWAPK
jgi:hypothetical protein